MTFAFHRYANLFPLIEGDELLYLAENVREHGLLDKIDLIDKGNGEGRGDFEILDGRNRYRALAWLISTGEILGPGWHRLAGKPLISKDLVVPIVGGETSLFKTFNPERDGDPLDYVISKNLPRRHLTDDQRRMVAADIVEMRQGRPGKTS